MLDITSEELIRIEEAASICRTHFSTVFRWVTKGVPGPTGARVRLEALRVGGKWVTTRTALQQFAEATTPRLEGEQTPLARSESKRRAASERAAEALEIAGI
ncbi:MAG: DUF1580 domain-containing protein [Gemmataceae bacterium]